MWEIVHFKELYLVKQSFCKLKTEETKMAKMDFNPAIVEIIYILIIKSLSLTVYLLFLTNLFFFNSFFF